MSNLSTLTHPNLNKQYIFTVLLSIILVNLNLPSYLCIGRLNFKFQIDETRAHINYLTTKRKSVYNLIRIWVTEI